MSTPTPSSGPERPTDPARDAPAAGDRPADEGSAGEGLADQRPAGERPSDERPAGERPASERSADGPRETPHEAAVMTAIRAHGLDPGPPWAAMSPARDEARRLVRKRLLMLAPLALIPIGLFVVSSFIDRRDPGGVPPVGPTTADAAAAESAAAQAAAVPWTAFVLPGVELLLAIGLGGWLIAVARRRRRAEARTGGFVAAATGRDLDVPTSRAQALEAIAHRTSVALRPTLVLSPRRVRTALEQETGGDFPRVQPRLVPAAVDLRGVMAFLLVVGGLGMLEAIEGSTSPIELHRTMGGMVAFFVVLAILTPKVWGFGDRTARCGKCAYELGPAPARDRCPECAHDWRWPGHVPGGKRRVNYPMLAVAMAIGFVAMSTVGVVLGRPGLWTARLLPTPVLVTLAARSDGGGFGTAMAIEGRTLTPDQIRRLAETHLPHAGSSTDVETRARAGDLFTTMTYDEIIRTAAATTPDIFSESQWARLGASLLRVSSAELATSPSGAMVVRLVLEESTGRVGWLTGIVVVGFEIPGRGAAPPIPGDRTPRLVTPSRDPGSTVRRVGDARSLALTLELTVPAELAAVLETNAVSSPGSDPRLVVHLRRATRAAQTQNTVAPGVTWAPDGTPDIVGMDHVAPLAVEVTRPAGSDS